MMDRVTDWRIGAVATGSAVAAYGLWRWWTNPVTLAAGQRQAVIAAIGTATPAFAGTNDQFREAVSKLGAQIRTDTTPAGGDVALVPPPSPPG